MSCNNLTYYIEARQLPVAGIGGHNFWVLRDTNGKILDQLHGLATGIGEGVNGKDKILSMGTKKSHKLNVFNYERMIDRTGSISDYHKYLQQSRMVYSGSKVDVMARWNNAEKIFNYINTLGDGDGLVYPGGGIDIWGRTVNSNTVYAVLGFLMGVTVWTFPGRIEPGVTNINRLVPQVMIDQLRRSLSELLKRLDDHPILHNQKIVDLTKNECADDFWDRLASEPVDTDCGNPPPISVTTMEAGFSIIVGSFIGFPNGSISDMEFPSTANLVHGIRQSPIGYSKFEIYLTNASSNRVFVTRAGSTGISVPTIDDAGIEEVQAVEILTYEELEIDGMVDN